MAQPKKRVKKKDKNLGANGTANITLSKGELWQNNGSFLGNYRNKFMNVFGQIGGSDRERFDNMDFESWQNGLYMDEINNHEIIDLAKLAIEDGLLAETARMKKVPGPSWC